MKIVVFADFHGSANALDDAVQICLKEKPDKTVVCGDLFGWSSPVEVRSLVAKLEGVLYLVKGNNDYLTAQSALPVEMEDNAVMYHFGRTLFFTHGDRYNGARIPPILKEGDVLVFGHSHIGRLSMNNGLYLANVGSLARPRDGEPSYLVIDEQGIELKRREGGRLDFLSWK